MSKKLLMFFMTLRAADSWTIILDCDVTLRLLTFCRGNAAKL